MGKEKPNLAHFDHPVSSEGVCVLGEGGGVLMNSCEVHSPKLWTHSKAYN